MCSGMQHSRQETAYHVACQPVTAARLSIVVPICAACVCGAAAAARGVSSKRSIFLGGWHDAVGGTIMWWHKTVT